MTVGWTWLIIDSNSDATGGMKQLYHVSVIIESLRWGRLGDGITGSCRSWGAKEVVFPILARSPGNSVVSKFNDSGGDTW